MILTEDYLLDQHRKLKKLHNELAERFDDISEKAKAAYNKTINDMKKETSKKETIGRRKPKNVEPKKAVEKVTKRGRKKKEVSEVAVVTDDTWCTWLQNIAIILSKKCEDKEIEIQELRRRLAIYEENWPRIKKIAKHWKKEAKERERAKERLKDENEWLYCLGKSKSDVILKLLDLMPWFRKKKAYDVVNEAAEKCYPDTITYKITYTVK